MFTNLDIQEIQQAVQEYAKRNLARFDHDISGRAVSVGAVRVFLDTSTSRDGTGTYAIRASVETVNDGNSMDERQPDVP